MSRSSVFSATIVAFLMFISVGMTVGFAQAAAADTCDGYESKENVPSSGSSSFDVTYKGATVGSITWDNDANPATVSWSVADGYSLTVCVKGGGEGLTTGSGQSGSLTPVDNGGGQSPTVSHFGWSVSLVTPPTETPTETLTETPTEPTEPPLAPTEPPLGPTELAVPPAQPPGGPDDEPVDGGLPPNDVVGASGTPPQISRVPEGSVAAGGGSTEGLENRNLFVLGFALMALAGASLIVSRRLVARKV